LRVCCYISIFNSKTADQQCWPLVCWSVDLLDYWGDTLTIKLTVFCRAKRARLAKMDKVANDDKDMKMDHMRRTLRSPGFEGLHLVREPPAEEAMLLALGLRVKLELEVLEEGELEVRAAAEEGGGGGEAAGGGEVEEGEEVGQRRS